MEDIHRTQEKLKTPVMYLKGVGERRARLLGRLGVHTVLDVMELFPRTYINRKVNPTLSEMQVGDLVSFTAQISWFDTRPTNSGKKRLTIGVNDGEKGLTCVWFSYPASYEKLFKPGQTIWLNGILSEFNGALQMNHPGFELLQGDQTVDDEEDFWKNRQVLPIYPLTEGLTQIIMRKIVLNAFASYAEYIEEVLPDFILEKHGFFPRKSALQKMHFSQDISSVEDVRHRFAYEELFYSQIMWARHQIAHREAENGICFVNQRELTTRLKNSLSFTLTVAQKRVIREIFEDMCSVKQMSRLVQGDVGSGKTIVSLFAMLLAVENGYQAALMAPTEILAEQHYQNFSRLLADYPVNVLLIKGGSYKGKAEQKKAIAEGKANLVVGTHALIQKDIVFFKLGLVVVDEQHRFGVEQRANLAKSNTHPDLLYLSATPIPRSLAMTVYGDLEVSQIDVLPPNRKPVLTYIRSERKLDTVLQAVRQELEKGRQAYFVCPLVEESEKVQLLDAQQLHEHLRTKVFPDFSCELMHGRMPASQKDEIMHRFKAGEIQVLVSTTVIEVGVDVANASVMVIEHAERFGLAQLHQLRGRVGRGAEQAFCYLIEHSPLSAIARERLATLSRTNDGFVVAEKDLQLRGPGELFGLEQSGMAIFHFANIVRDQAILALARVDAFEIVQKDPALKAPEHALLKKIYLHNYYKKEELVQY